MPSTATSASLAEPAPSEALASTHMAHARQPSLRCYVGRPGPGLAVIRLAVASWSSRPGAAR